MINVNRVAQTLCFGSNCNVLYFCSPSELQKITLSAEMWFVYGQYIKKVLVFWFSLWIFLKIKAFSLIPILYRKCIGACCVSRAFVNVFYEWLGWNKSRIEGQQMQNALKLWYLFKLIKCWNSDRSLYIFCLFNLCMYVAANVSYHLYIFSP